MSHLRTYGRLRRLKKGGTRPLRVSAERRLEALIEFDKIVDGWHEQTRERLAGAEQVILQLRRRLMALAPAEHPTCEYDGAAWQPYEQQHAEVQP